MVYGEKIVSTLEEKLDDLNIKRLELKNKIDILDKDIEDPIGETKILTDILNGEYTKEELEDDYSETLDDIMGIKDIIETIRLGKNLDSTQEAFLDSII